ncbi:MAG: nicotinate-nucleotide adenylyltransferase [Candidatus Omnitrophica bacterium]|nr:nicotinate-nucleotide adenylyltransferase [Candidatus Omnitrophota bacterium]
MAKSVNKQKRIGILGGTFNPIHSGHLNLAGHAKKILSLDKVIFVPAYIPPHKKIENGISPKDRLNMIGRAIRNEKSLMLSLYEIKRPRKSYSIDTLEYFKKKYGSKAKLFFLIGADSLIGIHSWRHIKKALKLAQFVVCGRPDYSLENCPKGINKINIPQKDVSSTKIRTLLKKGKSIKGIVPAAVEKYIKTKHLYIA